jgi:hypothetical protein
LQPPQIGTALKTGRRLVGGNARDLETIRLAMTALPNRPRCLLHVQRGQDH